MRILLLSFVVLLVVSTILAAPGVTPSNSACPSDCPTSYEPLCAGHGENNDDRDKKSFGNLCVMEKYNCEKEEHLVKLSDGECPGGKSIRLQ